MRKQPISLKRGAFIRLLGITFAAVLIFYGIGLYLNFLGIENVRSDLQAAMDKETEYIAGEFQREVENLIVFQQELASEAYLMRYTIAHSVLSDYQRIEHIQYISNQLLRMKRFSSMIDSASVHLPGVNKTITADKTVYDTMNKQAWEIFSRYSSFQPQHRQEWGGQLHLLYTKYEKKEPQFIIDVGLSSERMLKRLAVMSSENTAVMLLREDGSIYACSPGAQELSESLEWNGREYRSKSAGYFMSESPIPALKLRLRTINAVNEVMEPLLQHNQWVWVLTLLAGVLLTTYLLYFRQYILRPLNTIFESMRRAGKTGRFEIDEQHTEFDDIYAQFTAMVEKIERLAGRVYEEQFRAQRAELRQLQMQINPHFFYNTLFMVYRMAQAEGNEEIAKVCLNLSNYYRYITKIPEHDVCLKDEVTHVQQYLEIQEIRFSPRLTVDMQELPQALENEEIPPLMLQPIVENAFVHGMKGKMSGGHVEIRYDYGQTWFSVSVHDNSGQMDEQAVQALNHQLQCGELEAGSALQNLNRRMQLRYGKEYELKLESYQQGLRVTVMFPRKEREKSAVAAGR